MTDYKTVRLVIVLLGLTTLALVLIIGIGVHKEKDLPDGVWTLAGSGIGALGSLLASTRGSSSSDTGTVTASVDVTAPAGE